ncbi:MAG: hypothetical protein LBE21_07170 [Pseudomonadales bacterium]|nr:hypothetical protein [Pseudomonadales bacterium]
MAVLLQELRQQYGQDAELGADLKLLQEQVRRCRDTLRSLTQKADFKNLRPEALPLSEFLAQLLEQWRLLRPEVACDLSQPPGPSPTVEVEATLQQALINMLNNAADSSVKGLELKVFWNATHWTLSIRDFGAGISAELVAWLGTRLFSTKAEGLGVGLVLSQATINRLGGTVNLFPLQGDAQESGTLTEITLPLRLPRAAADPGAL